MTPLHGGVTLSFSFKEKQMKKVLNLFLIICSCFFISCETEGEPLKTGYYSYTFSFFYPANVTNDFEFTFEGKQGANGYISKSEPEGLLEVYDKNSNDLVFSQQISLADNNGVVQLIKTGEDVALYSPENYFSFTPTILFSNTSISYSMTFNGQVLTNSELNYIPKDKSVGTLEIFEADSEAPIYVSNEVIIENGTTINLLQLDTDFIELPADEEPEPIIPNTAKVRFLYIGDNTLTMDEIILNLYFADMNYDWSSELPITYPLLLKKGEISEYVEFDLTDVFYNLYFYSINDNTTGNVIVDFWYFYTANTPVLTDDWGAVKYKKATIQITDGGNGMKLLDGLSTLW